MDLSGVTVAIVTPFNKDLSVNYEAAKTIMERMVELGYHGLFPASSTGEVTKLSIEERVKLAETALSVAGGRALVMAGTGTGDHVSTIDIIRKYRDVGVNAVVVTPPYYIQYDWAALYAFYRKVLEKADIPVVLYTIPLAVGYNVPSEVFELLVNEYSAVVGIKDSSGDFRYHLDLLHLVGGKVAVLQGLDMFLVPSLVMGSHGAVLGSPNFLGDIPLAMYRLVKEGKLGDALALHGRLMPLWRFMGGCGLTGKLGGKWPTLYKLATELALGMDMGPPREPTPPIDDRDRAELEKLLRELGVLGRSPTP